jgi:N-methylhydantoinase B
VILNDPFQGGTHLPDITVVTPFFYRSRKKPVFYVANRAHHSDVGGMSPGSMCNNATEIYQEGVRVPPVKIVQAGIINKDIMSIIASNVRTPEEREWDIVAQISANTIGKQRLWELCDKYGKSEVMKYSAELQDYSDRIMRSVIRKIPDGDYSFSDYLDDDGISRKPVRIKAGINIKGSRVRVDFSGSSKQVKGCVNAVYAVTVSCVFYVFRCLINSDVPANSGCMRAISINAPEGSVVNATTAGCRIRWQC